MASLPVRMDIPRQCSYCLHYMIKVKGDNRGPFCRFWGKVFPEPTAWVRDEKIKKPGERVCRHWVNQIENNDSGSFNCNLSLSCTEGRQLIGSTLLWKY